MSELKTCPFCGADAKVEDYGSFKIVGCSKLSMLCPNPRMSVYNNDFSNWNSRTTDNTITEQDKVISELKAAVLRAKQALSNACELDLIHPNYKDETMEIVEDLHSVIAKHKQSKGE